MRCSIQCGISSSRGANILFGLKTGEKPKKLATINFPCLSIGQCAELNGASKFALKGNKRDRNLAGKAKKPMNDGST
jgi:hypothetical protein